MLGEETSAVTWRPVMGLHLYMCREQKGLMGRMAKGTGEKGGMERLQSVFCIGREIVGAGHALPEMATSSTKKKHGSWRKVNVTVPGILLCSAVLLFSRIQSWLIVGFARVFVRLSCSEILFFGEHMQNFWVSPVFATSNPQTLCGVRCRPVLASHTKHGIPVKWHLGERWDR